jgi:hypothetical protein
MLKTGFNYQKKVYMLKTGFNYQKQAENWFYLLKTGLYSGLENVSAFE